MKCQGNTRSSDGGSTRRRSVTGWANASPLEVTAATTTPRSPNASIFDMTPGSPEARHVGNPNPMAIDETIPEK
jgi:hypothetical protein